MMTTDLITNALNGERGEESIVGIIVVTEYDDGSYYDAAYQPNQYRTAMNKASECIIFSDCDDTLRDVYVVLLVKTVTEDIRAIHLEYTGWMPDMEIMWADDTGHIVWDACYPEWDH